MISFSRLNETFNYFIFELPSELKGPEFKPVNREANPTSSVSNKVNAPVEIFRKRRRVESDGENVTPVIASVSSSTSRQSIQQTQISSGAKTLRRRTNFQGLSKLSSLLAAYKSSSSANVPASIRGRRMTVSSITSKCNPNNRTTEVAKGNVRNGVNGQIVEKQVDCKEIGIEKPVLPKQSGKEPIENVKPIEQRPSMLFPRIIRIVSKGVSQNMQNNQNLPIPIKVLHKCDECDYATEVRTNLNRHKLMHTGEKPFKCRFCNYYY